MLKNLVILTTGATALATLATFAYNVWQDQRRLRITFEPLHWAHAPVDQTGKNFRVAFFIRVTAFNPGRTPNRITSITTWRDGEEVQNQRGMFQSVDVAPFGWAELELYLTVFESVPDPKQAYESVSMIEIEARALRGHQRRLFEAKAFRSLD